MTKNDMYAMLVKKAENNTHRMTRFEMECFCIGYFGKIDKDIDECISRLYIDNFIDE